jgi:hypothetical protein
MALLLVLPLGGCAIAPAWGMTVADARTHLDGTQEAAGGSWSNQDDPVLRGCDIPPWSTGERSSALRIGTPAADPEQVVETVARTWLDWGYRVTRQEIGVVTEVQGRFGDELLVFRVSDAAMTLQGESECVATA